MQPPSTWATTTDDPSSESEESAAPTKRRRGALACERCKSRKQKCILNADDQGLPCRRCGLAGAECIWMLPPLHRPRIHAECQTRIGALEDALRQLNPNHPLLSTTPSYEPASLSVPPVPPIPHDPTPARARIASTSDPRGEDGKDDDEVASGVALLSLNAANEPSYLRASSGHFWATVVSGSFKAPPSPLCACDGPVVPQPFSLPPPPQAFVDLPDKRTSLALYDAVYRHIQARYGCLDWVSIRGWVDSQPESVEWDRLDPSDTNGIKKKRTAAFFVWLVYALGARLLHGRPQAGLSIGDPVQYYAASIAHLDVVIRLHNLHNVQAFLLLIVNSIWSKEGTSAWYLTGMAMRIAVELGLHRKRSLSKGGSVYIEEMRKRTWWGVYCMDRWLSVTLGRPLSVSDQDIDQELPANIPCHGQLSTISPVIPMSSYDHTSMSSALRMIRLRQIESRIHMAVGTTHADLSRGMQDEHWRFLDEIDAWKASTSPHTASASSDPLVTIPSVYYNLKAETARLALLRPFLGRSGAGDVVLARAGKCAAEVCQLDRDLLQLYPTQYPLCFSDLHGTFLTGLILLSVIWIDSQAVSSTDAHKAVRACSNSLFIYAQHFKDAESYRDAFEELATVCLDSRERMPHPNNYPSAVSLASAMNRLDQGIVGPPGAQTLPDLSFDSAWMNAIGSSSTFDAGFANGFPTSTFDFHVPAELQPLPVTNLPPAQSTESLNNASIDDIFSQFFSANAPWNADDLAASFQWPNDMLFPQDAPTDFGHQ